jgi:hypothetical protein
MQSQKASRSFSEMVSVVESKVVQAMVGSVARSKTWMYFVPAVSLI